MKKLLGAVAVLVAVLCINSSAYAVENVAVINMETIYNGYTKAQDLADQLKIKDADIQKFVADAQIQLKKVATPVEKKNLEDKLSSDYKNMVESFQKYKDTQLKSIDDTILKTITDVAKTNKYDYVAHKATFIIGGADITTTVLTKLNATK